MYPRGYGQMKKIMENLELVRMYDECIPEMSPVLDSYVTKIQDLSMDLGRYEVYRLCAVLGVDLRVPSGNPAAKEATLIRGHRMLNKYIVGDLKSLIHAAIHNVYSRDSKRTLAILEEALRLMECPR